MAGLYMTYRLRLNGARYAAIVVCFLWTIGLAEAVVRPPLASPNDDDGRPVAAPEPAQILMLSGGLALVSGFISYQMIRRRN